MSETSSVGAAAGGGRRKRYPDFVHTGPGTLAGRYLRMFWQPVYVGADLPAGRALPLRVLGEDFTLYRGMSGRPQVLAPRCAHRGTVLSIGNVEGDTLRCFYHGWCFAADGRCIEQPAEAPQSAPRAHVRSYPTLEWHGLIFAYLGEGEAPEFVKLLSYEAGDGLGVAHRYRRDSNYFNQLENNVDEAHINFAHANSILTAVGFNKAIPLVSGHETGYGFVHHARRGDDPPRISHHLMPNAFYSVTHNYGLWMHYLNWRVPVEDHNHDTFSIQLVPGTEAAAYLEHRRRREEKLARYPRHQDLAAAILRGEMQVSEVEDHPDLVFIQDDMTLVGQGIGNDREAETLGRSDLSIVQLRRLWTRDLRAIEEGRAPKAWRWDPAIAPTNGLATQPQFETNHNNKAQMAN